MIPFDAEIIPGAPRAKHVRTQIFTCACKTEEPDAEFTNLSEGLALFKRNIYSRKRGFNRQLATSQEYIINEPTGSRQKMMGASHTRDR